MYEIFYTKQAKKDARKLASANLKSKAKPSTLKYYSRESISKPTAF